MRALIAILILSALTPRLAMAHDLGVQGNAFDIQEQNLVLYFLQKVAKVDWHKKATNLQDNIHDRLKDMPDVGLPDATETKTHYIDPSIVLQSDISAPIRQSDGSWKWHIAYHKGERVNPLDRVQPVTRMLFFNPRDEKQKAFALAAKAAYPNRLMLVVTGGDLEKISRQIGQPVFYALPFLVKKFELQSVPALAGVGTGTHYNRLAVTTFDAKSISQPDKAGLVVESAWYGIVNTEKK